MLKINEIFWSIQGEGLRLGFPSIFIRVAGCSLKCPYCDTVYSWKTGKLMLVDDILSEVDNYRGKYPHSQLVITGGEPLEQDVLPLVRELKRRDYFISIETNGLYFQNLPIDWWTVSPKDIRAFSIHQDLLKKINEIKLIVNKNLTVDIIKKIREKVSKVPIFLQPDRSEKGRYKKTFSLFRQCQQKRIENIRTGIQLHNIYKVK